MRRYSGQKALYEVINRSKSKPAPKISVKRPGLLERLKPQLQKLRRPKAPKASKTVSRVESPDAAVARPIPILKPPKPVSFSEPAATAGSGQTWLKPKAVQFNAGRIEVSLPYQIGIAVGLFVVLLLLAVFRLGQIDQKSRYNDVGRASRAGIESTAAAAAGGNATTVEASAPAENGGSENTAAPAPTGDNWIVIARSELRNDLVPVRAHFDEHGIRTGIVSFERLREHFEEYGLNTSVLPQGSGYLLVTAQMYDNPEKIGTTGYEAKQKIIEVGALYKGKAPQGYETFAPHYFSDAYGMKMR